MGRVVVCYQALCFRQNESSPVQVVFVAPTCDLDLWAKVPTRMSSKPRGFQRAEMRNHVADLQKFFAQDTTHSNSSPTSILLGLEPNHRELVTLKAPDGQVISFESLGKEPILAEVGIDFEEWRSTDYDDIEIEIDALFSNLEGHREGSPNEREGEQPSADFATDASSNGFDGDADVDASDYDIEVPDDIEDDTADSEDIEAESEPVLDELESLPEDLRLADLDTLRRAWRERNAGLREPERAKKLRDLLKDERKPGLIIDGQHRVSATKDRPPTPFAVSFLPNADWPELAFQFIVNNSTAKKVDDNLLSAIVGQSLSADELQRIESRLSRAGIKVQLIRAGTRVQLEDNPFKGMIRTKTVGEPGFLEASAMQRQVVGLWFGRRGRLGDKPGMASFQAFKEESSPSRKHSMGDLFLANCPGRRIRDRVLSWQDDDWFAYFSAFWEAFRKAYGPSGLWPATTAEWPNSSIRPLTSDQERVQLLLRATVLGPLQVAVLQRWADMRFDASLQANQSLKKMKVTPAQFETEIAGILAPLTADFFINLTATGMDGSASVKNSFMRAVSDVITRTRTSADVQGLSIYNNIFG